MTAKENVFSSFVVIWPIELWVATDQTGTQRVVKGALCSSGEEISIRGEKSSLADLFFFDV